MSKLASKYDKIFFFFLLKDMNQGLEEGILRTVNQAEKHTLATTSLGCNGTPDVRSFMIEAGVKRKLVLRYF
jgi:hypothetical protein